MDTPHRAAGVPVPYRLTVEGDLTELLVETERDPPSLWSGIGAP